MGLGLMGSTSRSYRLHHDEEVWCLWIQGFRFPSLALGPGSRAMSMHKVCFAADVHLVRTMWLNCMLVYGAFGNGL